MRKLQSFVEYKSLTEAEVKRSKSSSLLSQYRLVANGVAECFSLYTYFISLLESKVNPNDWENFKKSIYAKKGYEEKWDYLETLAEKLYAILADYSTRKNQNLGNLHMRTNFVSEDAKDIRSALKKYRKASDLICSELDKDKIPEALKLIDQAIGGIKPFELMESIQNYSLLESETRPAPAEAAVLQLADTMAAQIINLRLTLRHLAMTLPQLKSSADKSESNVLDPLAKKIEGFINSEYKPKERLPISKQVKQLYAAKGWDIENQFQKYMVDAWDELTGMQQEIETEASKIEGYKGQAVDRYQVRNDAQEFIDAGDRIVTAIKEKVFKKLRIEALKYKSGSILPMGPIQGRAGSLKQQTTKTSSGVNPFGQDVDKSGAEQLQNYLIKKYQTK
jgi:hypothetical protein